MLSADVASIDLNIDANTMYIDVSNNRVGINNATPSTALDVTGSVTADSLTSSGPINLTAGALAAAGNAGLSHRSTDNKVYLQAGTGGFNILDDQQNTHVAIDSAGVSSFFNNVGIGTSSPSTSLDVTGTADAETGVTVTHSRSGVGYTLLLNNTNNGANKGSGIKWQGGGFDTAAIIGRSDAAAASGDAPGFLTFHTSDDGSEGLAERMRISSAGSVGIGVVPESWYTGGSLKALQVGGSTALFNLFGTRTVLADNFYLQAGTGADKYITTNEATQYIQENGTHVWKHAPSGTADATISFSESMRIDSSGKVGISTSIPGSFNAGANNLVVGSGSGSEGITIYGGNESNIFFADGTAGSAAYVGRIEYSHSVNNMLFYVNNANAMTIDDSGSLLVGTTDASIWNNTTGNGINLNGGLGLIASARTNAEPLMINRMGTDGEIIKLNKDGATVGSIGSSSGYLLAGSTNLGLYYNGATTQIYPVNTATSGNLDGTTDLGRTTARFKDIYATNGTIQTSDRNEKQDIEALSDAEQRVAVATKGLLRKFRWKSSVEEKGDEARTHFGIIAQDLQAAFAAEGLDAGDYAMFINSTWTDEETGEERSRMGVRYSELLAFIIAAI